MSFPLMVRAIRLALEAVDRGLEAAARTLGASRLDVFASVTLPLMLPGIVSGCIVAFAAALGDFGATITFVGNVEGETQTLSLAIYSLTQTPDGDAAALRLVLISLMLALAALFVSECAGAARAPLSSVVSEPCDDAQNDDRIADPGPQASRRLSISLAIIDLPACGADRAVRRERRRQVDADQSRGRPESARRRPHRGWIAGLLRQGGRRRRADRAARTRLSCSRMRGCFRT